MHSEKLIAVGQLAAGIAHEINTPVQFVGDNLRCCAELFCDLERLFREYRGLLGNLERDGLCGPQVTALRRLESEIDVDYIFDDMPQAFSQSLEGVERIRTIVQAMKDFSHVDRLEEKTFFDVNAAIRSTLVVARNEIKYVADIHTELGELPPVPGYPSEINQVFLNLLVNAAHAIRDAGRDEPGRITVRTRAEEGCVVISISDTGGGIPEPVQSRIFEPFFTTKEVGRGTGQGLPISRNIVVERHAGRLEFETQLGRGTTFHVFLPLACDDAPAGE